MGTLTYKGATAEEALGSQPVTSVPAAEAQGFEDNEEAVAGAEIFAQVEAAASATSISVPARPTSAPDLSDVGASNRGLEFFANYVSNPAQFGNNVMPPYAGLGEENLRLLGIFLDASGGPEE